MSTFLLIAVILTSICLQIWQQCGESTRWNGMFNATPFRAYFAEVGRRQSISDRLRAILDASSEHTSCKRFRAPKSLKSLLGIQGFLTEKCMISISSLTREAPIGRRSINFADIPGSHYLRMLSSCLSSRFVFVVRFGNCSRKQLSIKVCKILYFSSSFWRI